MDKSTKKYYRTLFLKTAQSLQKNGFNDVRFFESSSEAKKEILILIPEGRTVGIGGSQTVTESGLLPELEKNRTIVKHNPEMDASQRMEIWKKAARCDFYIASPQAITLDGKMFFIDKYGNRVSSVIFGPGRVILIAGCNKIVKDESEAATRSRELAAVKNAVRLDSKAPCVKTGECEDCSSTGRICNVSVGLLKRPPLTDYSIFLINEELGY